MRSLVHSIRLRHIVVLTTACLLLACKSDETVVAYGAASQKWTLVEINDLPAPSPATLTFPETGWIAGQAACNSYRATMDVPYPWFETGPILATKSICPEIAAETAFLAALAEMTLSEVLGDTLILSTTDGRKLVFTTAG